jgi:hypothetical protein
MLNDEIKKKISIKKKYIVNRANLIKELRDYKNHIKSKPLQIIKHNF